MSRANAALSLPPGDRDDEPAPELFSPAAPSKPDYQEQPPELPTLLVLRKVMEGRQLAFAELEMALRREDWALADRAAFVLRDTCMHNMQILATRLHKEIQHHRRSLLERPKVEA